MNVVRNFFDVNFELVLFAYGLVFFILGLAIALQSRQHSRLVLARSLAWLALFGITHGLHEWGYLFIPIQATYMNHAGISLLQFFQVALLAISFLALFQFGADLTRERWPFLEWVPFVTGLVWGATLGLLGIATTIGVGLWQQYASISARYFIAFPGALLAAYGLRYQAKQQIRPLELPRIYRTLRTAGLAFVAYAFFAGLLVPAAAFFPASALNEGVTMALVGVPVPVFRSLIGLIILITIVRAMEVFDVEIERLIERMEIEQSLAAERERIGRELHDGAIQRVYTAGLIIESARRKVEDETLVAQRLDRAMTALNEAIGSLRAYMTDLRAAPPTVSLQEGLRQYAQDPRFTTFMEVDLAVDMPDAATFDPAQTMHILAIAGEALSNAARHSGAERVWLRASRENGQFLMSITDDGSGFSYGTRDSGYGLRNMRDRARLLGGELKIESAQGQGTRIILSIPWEEA